MTAVLTNTWTKIAPGVKPWAGREVLVRMSDGSKRTLEWNGYYWADPQTHIRQRYTLDGLRPTHFYIFEKFKDDGD